jgi:NAD+ diphosphatase
MSAPDPPAFAFVGSRLVLLEHDGTSRLPTHAELVEALGEAALRAGRAPGVVPTPTGRLAAYGFDEEASLPEGFRLESLRVAYHELAEVDFRSAGTARQRVEWYRTHRYCARCGTPTEPTADEQAMACPACDQLHFPRVSPAVIVLVQREDRALLARSPHFVPGVYSTLAGFVEAGESLEECVHREIREEVGVGVTNLRYFGSQPHPFPHSLMVGFVADWLEGDIDMDPDEIEDARWFTRHDLPDLPHPMSIARALIEDFVDRTA